MNRVILLFVLSIALQYNVDAQNSNPCGTTWSAWNTAWSVSNWKVLYRLQFASKSCDCGYKFVQMQHTIPYKTSVNIEFEGTGCDNSYQKESFGCHIVGGEIAKSSGNWHLFKSVTGILKVEIEFEDGKKRIRYVTNKSGTTKYINGVTEKEYNEMQQKQKAAESAQRSNQNNSSTGSSVNNGTRGSSSGNLSGSGVNYSGNSGTGSPNGNNNYGGSTNNNNTQTEQERIRKERESQILAQQQAVQKQKEEQEKQRQEAWRREQERYEEELRQITRKSEARAQTHAAVSQSIGAVFSTIQENKAKKGLAADDTKRRKTLEELKNKLASGEYELIDCETCKGDGYLNCANCKNNGKEKCSGCGGKGGKSCEFCNGAGKKQWGTYTLACTNCMGTGTRQCMACNNVGESICVICHGRGERQCYCDGTGKRLKRKDNTQRDPIKSKESEMANSILMENAAADSKILENLTLTKPDATGPDSVYYLSYQRTYGETTFSPATVNVYMVYKYSDGTYPLMSSVYQKIKLEPVVTTQSVVVFAGYYEDKNAVSKVVKNITEKASQQGIKINYQNKVHVVNPRQVHTIKNDDFWNN